MSKPPIDERVITDYLLGAAPEAETERLDELRVTDGDFAWQIQAVENDLVDVYVRGKLSGDALESFNSHYLASPRRREKVRFAEMFLALTEQLPKGGTAEARETVAASTTAGKTDSSTPFWWGFFTFPRLTLQWSFAAAALLLLLAGGYLTLVNLRLRSQMAQTQAERAGAEERAKELQRRLAEQRSADAEPEKELSRVRERLAQLEAQLTAGRTSVEPRALQIIAFNLAPQTRGVGQITTLGLPTGTDYVALTLALETDDFPAYRAALRDPATGQILWRSGRLKTSSQGKMVRVSLRASLFKAQNYVLEISGSSATGGADLVNSYPFRVVQQ